MTQEITFDLVEENSTPFFAPVSSDLIDGLVGEYEKIRKHIEEISDFVSDPQVTHTLHYFIEGNCNDERSRGHSKVSVTELFASKGAIGALNASYWAKALNLTDVFSMMPQKRRDEWNQQILNPSGKKRYNRDTQEEEFEIEPLPDFLEDTVRSTLLNLLNARQTFLAERVDGIFRGLSGEHVTNAPEAFGKRMIIANVMSEYGYSNHSKNGLINDLRCVIAKFMGREEPKYWASDSLFNQMKSNFGDWIIVDGGAIKARLYKKGTVHMEIHPDMAWRLNATLAHLYPLAIPAKFRERPKKKIKEFELIQRPLPFSVLRILDRMTITRKRVSEWPERYETIKNTYDIHYSDWKDSALSEAMNILQSLGGAPAGRKEVEFDYDALPIIKEIVVSGCIPDKKAHQFYPTPKDLAERVVRMADIQSGQHILEPSAGHGALVDCIDIDCEIVCVEASKLNAKVLASKKYNVFCDDFLLWNTSEKFDRIIMNPPFSEGRAEAHVKRASELVQSMGRIVAVMPSGAKDRVELPGFEIKWSEVISGAFPGVSVSVVLMTADKTC